MNRAIKVEGLSKRYLLGHKAQERPDTLLDRLTLLGNNLVKRIRYPFLSGNSDLMEEFWALREIDFEVKKGDRLGIIGRNGAGKSTLLKVLSRIVEPTSGKIEMYGQTSSLLEVGTGFHPELTGRENVFLNGSILGMSRRDIQKRFDEIVAFSEVERFLDTPVKRYSSGMYVRLAFSVAAHMEPEILIVDEVLAVGDAAFQKKCLTKIGAIGDEGRTIIFVSHNINSVRKLCNKGLLLEEGRTNGITEIERAIGAYAALQQKSEENFSCDVDYPHPELFRFSELWINGEQPTETVRVDADQPIYLRFRFVIQAPLREFRVLCDIESDDQTLLIRNFHNRGAESAEIFEPGEYEAEVTIPPILGPSRYSIVLRANQANIRILTPTQGLRIGVLPHLTAAWSAPYPNQSFHSKLDLPMEWKIRKR